jgi:hypothetical protein
MTLAEQLKQPLKGTPFEDGHNDGYVYLYAGPYLIPVPNTDMRKKAIPYHDLHHLLTGYNNSRIGEGEVGAWELGSGCWSNPAAVFLNLGGVSTGLLYSPRRICKAFIRGCRSRNLYGLSLDDILSSTESEMKAYLFDEQIKGHSSLLNYLKLIAYFSASVLAIPVLLLFGFLFSLIKE